MAPKVWTGSHAGSFIFRGIFTKNFGCSEARSITRLPHHMLWKLRLLSRPLFPQRGTSKRRAGGASSSDSAKMHSEGEAAASVQAVFFVSVTRRGEFACATTEQLAQLLAALRLFPDSRGVVEKACDALITSIEQRQGFADLAVDAGAAEALVMCFPHENSNARAWVTGAALVSRCSPPQLRRFSNAGWPDAALSLLLRLRRSENGVELSVENWCPATYVLSFCLAKNESSREGGCWRRAQWRRELCLAPVPLTACSASTLRGVHNMNLSRYAGARLLHVLLVSELHVPPPPTPNAAAAQLAETSESSGTGTAAALNVLLELFSSGWREGRPPPRLLPGKISTLEDLLDAGGFEAICAALRSAPDHADTQVRMPPSGAFCKLPCLYGAPLHTRKKQCVCLMS